MNTPDDGKGVTAHSLTGAPSPRKPNTHGIERSEALTHEYM
jgi:hypothetical protein